MEERQFKYEEKIMYGGKVDRRLIKDFVVKLSRESNLRNTLRMTGDGSFFNPRRQMLVYTDNETEIEVGEVDICGGSCIVRSNNEEKYNELATKITQECGRLGLEYMEKHCTLADLI